jgi:hypothetical protein
LQPVELEYKALIASMMSAFYRERPTEAAHHARHLSTETQDSSETVRPANTRGEEDESATLYAEQDGQSHIIHAGATEADGQDDQLRKWISELPEQSGSVKPCTSCAFG